jgi:hypothetical protein
VHGSRRIASILGASQFAEGVDSANYQDTGDKGVTPVEIGLRFAERIAAHDVPGVVAFGRIVVKDHSRALTRGSWCFPGSMATRYGVQPVGGVNEAGYSAGEVVPVMLFMFPLTAASAIPTRREFV